MVSRKESAQGHQQADGVPLGYAAAPRTMGRARARITRHALALGSVQAFLWPGAPRPYLDQSPLRSRAETWCLGAAKHAGPQHFSGPGREAFEYDQTAIPGGRTRASWGIGQIGGTKGWSTRKRVRAVKYRQLYSDSVSGSDCRFSAWLQAVRIGCYGIGFAAASTPQIVACKLLCEKLTTLQFSTLC